MHNETRLRKYIDSINGRMIFAFSVSFRMSTGIQVEARVILFGVQQCIQRGFMCFWIETDSLSVVQVL